MNTKTKLPKAVGLPKVPSLSQVTLKIRRFDAARDKQDSASRYDIFKVDLIPGNTLLQCLDEIKWKLDGSLTYRRNCKNSICGS